MVYCGKLSKACQPCRTRKMRCDFNRDQCGQCRRAHLTCFGYRDSHGVRFRDETTNVVRREVIRNEGILRSSNITLSIDVRARNCFFSDYVLGNSIAFDYLQVFCAQETVDEHLQASIDAVSLAHFANEVQSRDVLNDALKKYSTAICMTSRAMQSIERATTDTTLLSVLLLDLYEKITNYKQKSLKSWTSHIEGATALVKLRGHAQFANATGLRMFLQLTSTILIGCVCQEVPVPENLKDLRQYAGRFVDTNDPKWRISDQMILFIALRVAIKKGSLSSDDIIAQAKQIDGQLDLISRSMPPTWQYAIVQTSSVSEAVYESYFHIFPDYFTSRSWNIIRLTRIQLNEILHERYSIAFDVIQADNSKQIVLKVAADICASVPQYVQRPQPLVTHHLNHSTLLSRTESNPSEVLKQPLNRTVSVGRVEQVPHSTRAQSENSSSPSELACSYGLLFPLFVAARSPLSPEKMRKWIMNRMRYMGTVMSIKKANVVAEILENGGDHNPWAVYAMIGSYTFSA